MNLIFIYGPPAVGKTTVGRELAHQTGHRFFYNHLTVPAAKAIFPDSKGPDYDPRYTALLHKLRLDGLTAAADAGFNTIFTLAYSGTKDDDFVIQIADIFASRGGQVHFVELQAPDHVLAQRVANPDRLQLNQQKMTDPAHLEEVLAGRDLHASVPYQGVLKIDTTQLSPHDAVEQILQAFSLRGNQE